MTQHTPTWTYDHRDDGAWIICHNGKPTLTIIDKDHNFTVNVAKILNRGEAAPALLEALRQIIDTEPDYRKANRFAKIEQIAQAAIAKATE